MSFPRYLQYKPSGVEWLGDVPVHWSLRKIGHLATIEGGGTPSREKIEYWNGDIPWVSPKDMKFEDIRGSEEMITELGVESSTTAVVPAGCVLMVIRSGILQHTIPVGINSVPVALNQDLKSFRFLPGTCLPRFFLRWVQGLNDSLLLEWMNEGATVESFDLPRMKNMVLPLPPIEEQIEVVEFLDRETAKIDGLVAEQRRLIELLKEKRQAVISHAVTKGLNPDAPMKPSGIDWLGDVPAHWKVLPWRRVILSLKDFGSNGSFAGLRENVQYLASPSYARLVRLTDLRDNLENDGGVYVSKESYHYLSQSSLLGGEFLIANVGAYAGFVCEMPLFDMPATLGPNMMMVKNWRDDLVSIKYLITSAQSSEAKQQLHVLATASSAQPKLNKDDVRAVVMPLPPLLEQAAIIEYIKSKSGEFDALTSEAERAIDLLQERRTALISAAVTGKIDVRGVAALEAP